MAVVCTPVCVIHVACGMWHALPCVVNCVMAFSGAPRGSRSCCRAHRPKGKRSMHLRLQPARLMELLPGTSAQEQGKHAGAFTRDTLVHGLSFSRLRCVCCVAHAVGRVLDGVCSGAHVWGGVVHAALHACENQSMVRMAENFSLRPERDRPERKVSAIPKRGSSLGQLGSPPVG